MVYFIYPKPGKFEHNLKVYSTILLFDCKSDSLPILSTSYLLHLYHEFCEWRPHTASGSPSPTFTGKRKQSVLLHHPTDDCAGKYGPEKWGEGSRESKADFLGLQALVGYGITKIQPCDFLMTERLRLRLLCELKNVSKHIITHEL